MQKQQICSHRVVNSMQSYLDAISRPLMFSHEFRLYLHLIYLLCNVNVDH
nr:MAG TPA: hypothetical protein [Caudoviricetes sp.]